MHTHTHTEGYYGTQFLEKWIKGNVYLDSKYILKSTQFFPSCISQELLGDPLSSHHLQPHGVGFSGNVVKFKDIYHTAHM